MAVSTVSPSSAAAGSPSRTKGTGARAFLGTRWSRAVFTVMEVVPIYLRPTSTRSKPYTRSRITIAQAVRATISADTAAISGSIDSVAYMYMRTGSVTVLGEVTKIDIVTSSKLLMKASNQPPVTPGKIIGSVMRVNTVAWLAPSDSAACSALRSTPTSAARTVASGADASASHRLFQNDCTKSECANTALNQRSENSVVGSVSVLCGVNATMHTTSSGASMKVMTSALNARAKGPFFCITSAQRFLVPALNQPVVAQHHHQVGHQQRQRNRCAQGPVQLVQVFVVHHRSHHLQAPPAQQAGDGERTGRQPKHDQAARQNAWQHLRQDNASQRGEGRRLQRQGGVLHTRVELLQRCPHRDHHERQHHMHQRNHHGDLGVKHLHGAESK